MTTAPHRPEPEYSAGADALLEYTSTAAISRVFAARSWPAGYDVAFTRVPGSTTPVNSSRMMPSTIRAPSRDGSQSWTSALPSRRRERLLAVSDMPNDELVRTRRDVQEDDRAGRIGERAAVQVGEGDERLGHRLPGVRVHQPRDEARYLVRLDPGLLRQSRPWHHGDRRGREPHEPAGPNDLPYTGPGGRRRGGWPR